jgi:hypothetical protein
MCRVKLIGYALYVLELFFACAIDTHMLELQDSVIAQQRFFSSILFPLRFTKLLNIKIWLINSLSLSETTYLLFLYFEV